MPTTVQCVLRSWRLPLVLVHVLIACASCALVVMLLSRALHTARTTHPLHSMASTYECYPEQQLGSRGAKDLNGTFSIILQNE